MSITRTLILVLSFVLSSCSTTVYKSKGGSQISLNKRPSHNKVVKIEGDHNSYMWGFLPSTNEINVAGLLERNGLKSVSGVQIHNKVEFTDVLFAVASIGFYIPKSFTITAFTDE